MVAIATAIVLHRRRLLTQNARQLSQRSFRDMSLEELNQPIELSPIDLPTAPDENIHNVTQNREESPEPGSSHIAGTVQYRLEFGFHPITCAAPAIYTTVKDDDLYLTTCSPTPNFGENVTLNDH